MLVAIIFLTVLGALSGLLLAVIAKRFAVNQDPRIEQITEALPGANCGGCGFGGCAAYAKAIVENSGNINCCAPGGQETADKIGQIMGVTADIQDKKCAIVHCAGDDRLSDQRALYHGTASCSAANLVGGGAKACTYGCLGFGDCAQVCPTGAIAVTDYHLAVVKPELCIACGKCINACPRHIITLESLKTPYQILCSSQDTPKQRHTYCRASCLGCKMCNKKAPDNFTMNGLVAKAQPTEANLQQAEEARLFCATGALVNSQDIPLYDWVTNLENRESFKQKQAKYKEEAKAARLKALAQKQDNEAKTGAKND